MKCSWHKRIVVHLNMLSFTRSLLSLYTERKSRERLSHYHMIVFSFWQLCINWTRISDIKFDKVFFLNLNSSICCRNSFFRVLCHIYAHLSQKKSPELWYSDETGTWGLIHFWVYKSNHKIAVFFEFISHTFIFTILSNVVNSHSTSEVFHCVCM